MAQPKVRQGPETAQERVLDCKATGRGEQENSPTAVSSSLGLGCHKASTCCLLLPKLNHSRFRCPQGTAGTNSPHCYSSQNLQLSKTEIFPVVQHDFREIQDSSVVPWFWYTGEVKAGFSLETLLSSWSSHRHSTLSTQLAPWTPAELWH